MKNDRTWLAVIAGLACAAIPTLFAGCSSGIGPETPAAPKSYKVYISGYSVVSRGEGDVSHYPCYWDGESRIALPGDSDDVGRALAIAASGGSVYLAGNIGTIDYDENEGGACYWKDGMRTDIQGNEAVAIFVEGGKVYAAVRGSWENVLVNGVLSNVYNAVYVAGAVSPLPGPGAIEGTSPQRYQETVISGIAVSGGVPFAVGYGGSDIGTVPCCWDGTTVNQALVAAKGFAYGACAAGASVYTVGCYIDGDNKHLPCYWKGVDRIALPIEAGDSGAHAKGIKVVDGVVYTAGYRFIGDEYTGTKIPCYWIGTTRKDLPIGDSLYGEAVGLEVGDGVVYTVGYYDDGSKYVSCYWKGDTRVDLAGDGDYAFATGIALIEE